MTRKFNSDDRLELIQKISQNLNITLKKVSSAYQKLYTDENGNTYCIFNGGQWHSIYDSMFRELISRQGKDIFIILGALDKQNNVKVYKGTFHKNLIPAMPEQPEKGKQYYLNFKISGNEATLDQHPEQKLIKIFEYEPSGNFINNDDSNKNVEVNNFTNTENPIPHKDKKKNIVLQESPDVEKSIVAKDGSFDIRKCIESALWLEACLDEDDIRFKFRILAFEKLEFDYDTLGDDLDFDVSDGVLWLLVLQLVNLTKTTINCDDIKGNFRIVDSDDFCFEFVEDRELCGYSEFATRAKLKRFYSGELKPKLTATGGLLFLLPNENTNYFINLESGSLKVL
ncbi:hypothetical protein EOM81_07270 [bacterium]|nr:hypothetical protein [bacterium]